MCSRLSCSSVNPISGLFGSLRHCSITARDGAWWLEDLGSRNGTFLNGERVVSAGALADGDMMQLGALDVEFHTLRNERQGSETEWYVRDPPQGLDGLTHRILTILCQPLIDGDVLSEPAPLGEVADRAGVSADVVNSLLQDAARSLGIAPGDLHDLAQTAVARGVVG